MRMKRIREGLKSDLEREDVLSGRGGKSGRRRWCRRRIGERREEGVGRQGEGGEERGRGRG